MEPKLHILLYTLRHRHDSLYKPLQLRFADVIDFALRSPKVEPSTV
jgi:hypothetical protein